jgi:hypothetical protein
VEEISLSEVGLSGKVSSSEKVVLELLAIEAGVVKEGSGFLVVPLSVCHQGRSC